MQIFPKRFGSGVGLLGLFAMEGLSVQSGAANFQPVAAPTSVAVSPSAVFEYSTVTIRGTSLSIANTSSVTITISIDAASTPNRNSTADDVHVVTAVLSPSGQFATTYKAGADGHYRVVVKGPDGKGSAESSFDVMSPDDAADKDVTASKTLAKSENSLLDVAEKEIAALPPSPAKDELEIKTAALKQHLAQAPMMQKQLLDALTQLNQAAEKDPDILPELSPLYSDLDEAKLAIDAENNKLQQVIAQAGQKNATCDNLDTIDEVFKTISLAMELAGKPIEIAYNFFVDKESSKAVAALPTKKLSDTRKFALTEAMKVGAGMLTGPDGWVSAGLGLVADVSQFLAQKLFAQYCEKFEGPIHAQFRAEMRTGGQPWFTYKLDIRGKLQLRYQKDATLKAGEPIALTGQLEGVVEKFEMAENAILLDPALRKSVMVHMVIQPQGTRYVEEMGTYGRSALPASFYIPVKGALLNNKITLTWDAASKDFTPLVRGKIVYVFLSAGAPLPVVQAIDHPVQNAYFIFTRGMMASPKFDVTTDRSESSIDHTFTRTVEDTTADFQIIWLINVHACNPSCLDWHG